MEFTWNSSSLRYLNCASLTLAGGASPNRQISEKDLGSDPRGASLGVRFAGGLRPPVHLRKQRSAPLTAKRTTRTSRAKSPEKAPAKRKAPAKKSAASLPPEPSRKLLDLVLKTLDRDKAEDVVSIELTNKSPMADYMVIASGRSNRHVAAIAEHLTEELKKQGHGGKAEGLPAGDWVLVDAMDVIVHVFRPEVRAFYNLEKMWGNGAALAEAV
jgi:ribosome-associated protein